MDSVRPVSDGYRVHLTDGSVLSVSPDTRVRYNLDADTSLDPQALTELRHETALREAQAAALRLLARAEHTRRGLGLKLEQRGHDRELVRTVVDGLTDLGYLDDRRAASAWVEQRLARRPASRSALLAGLARHGVPREIAESVVKERVSPESEEAAARRQLERLYPTPESREGLRTDRVQRDRAIRRLVGRGFSTRAVRRALEDRESDGDPP